MAGNLTAWPTNVPAEPGTYTVKLDLGNGMTDVAVVHATLPGGYHLLVGRIRRAMRRWSGASGTRWQARSPSCRCSAPSAAS